MTKSPDLHGEIKAKLTPLAHAVRFAMRCGITTAADLAIELECTQSAIYRAIKQLKDADRTVTESDHTVKSDRTELTIRSESDRTVTKTDRTVTHARVIDNNKLTSLEETPVFKKHPLPPRKPKSATSRPNAPTPLEALAAFQAWNATALRCGLPQAAKLTPDRQRKIIARLREYGIDGWNAALANIEKSSFLTGSNDRNFRADLDFLVQAKSFGKVHDGGYGNGRHAKSEIKISMTPHESEEAVAARRERMLAELGVI